MTGEGSAGDEGRRSGGERRPRPFFRLKPPPLPAVPARGSVRGRSAGREERMGGNEPKDPESLRDLPTVALVERHRAGDARALEVLFARYGERIERIVYVRSGGFLRSREQVGDLVQEVLLRMFQDLDRYEVREDARFIDWAATICERTLKNRVRYHEADKRDGHREREMPRRAPDMESSVSWDVVASDVSPPERLGELERQQLVDDCIGELREDQREVLLLRDFAGASWDYVTLALGKESKGAAQQLHRRARIALGERLRMRGE